MGCVIAGGTASPACAERFTPPGIERGGIYIFNYEEITAFTSAVAGEVSALTLGSDVGFKLDMHKNTISWSEELVASETGNYYNQTFGGKIISFDTTTMLAIEGFVDVDVVIIAKMKNGDFITLGETGGLKLTTNTKNSGATAGDETGDMLEFTGINNGKAQKFFITDEATTLTALDSYL